MKPESSAARQLAVGEVAEVLANHRLEEVRINLIFEAWLFVHRIRVDVLLHAFGVVDELIDVVNKIRPVHSKPTLCPAA